MIGILLNECRKTFPGVPLFLYGHSLGGGMVLDYLLRKNPQVMGAIVTSPWLKLSFEPEDESQNGRFHEEYSAVACSVIGPGG
jgi:alpha-beta hydrolase superfamily lysophospholipase